MTDLRDQLRSLVDGAAEPVHPAEVIGPRALWSDTSTRRPRRPIAPALAGVAAIALAVAGVAVVAARHHPAEQTTAGSTGAASAPADPASCDPEPCRDVDDAEATALLGMPVAMPSGIPEGWELAISEVYFYPAGAEAGRPPGPVFDADTVGLWRSWSPPGESYTEGCPTSIRLWVSPYQPGSQPPDTFPTGITLPDGTPVFGFEPATTVCGNPGGEEANRSDLWWTHAGADYRLSSFGAPADAVHSVVSSLP